jgi:Right handed beta helix region
LNIIQKPAKINSIFLAIVLIAGIFAAVYPSFIIGIQAQSEYEYENGYGSQKNSYNYNSEYPPSPDYPSTEYKSDRYNAPEYPPSPSSEYPQSDYESNQENDYYNYPSAEDHPPADIVVPIDFDTIQEAIDAADEGDVIKVLPGTYTEQLIINKSLTIIGPGSKSTIINAPTVLTNGTLGIPYIVEIINEAEVTMKGFTISGLETSSCGDNPLNGVTGFNVLEGAILNLDSSTIKNCTFVGIRIGTPPFLGSQIGHAIITQTDITDYRSGGIVTFSSDSSLTITKSNIIASDNSNIVGQIGILVEFGAKGIITHNKISKNICEGLPGCGTDWFNEIQGFGIAITCADNGSVISNNYISNNDLAIGLGGESESCVVDHNKITDNLVFGIVVADSEQTISNTKIFGGGVGVLAAAGLANTTATLDQVKIVGAEIPIQALSSGNLTAAVNVLSPSVFLP